MTKSKELNPVKRRVWFNGISGRMGQETCSQLQRHKTLVLAGGSDQSTKIASKEFSSNFNSADLVIDFSSPAGNAALFNSAALSCGQCFLIGTTGLDANFFKKWEKLAVRNNLLVVVAANTSFGIYILARQVGALAAVLTAENWDIEIVETHHSKKQDSPSGTALLLARMISKACPGYKVTTGRSKSRVPNSIGIHSVRGGGVFGEHQIRFIAQHEDIDLTHRAFSRVLFAEGALVLGERLLKSKKHGFYLLEDF
ncbi:MAG: 4-hydroxy-tetrahydrodipicolinate reductase [Proteobacteria bacterium]|nr:4-hydroxy-tetrahydrodipicolinate reductase [Pseudomonadota bacterium]